MLGTIVNALAVLVGGVLGVFLRKGISEKYKNAIMQGIGLSTFVIGLMSVLETQSILTLLFSIVIGTIIGEAIGIEDKLDGAGRWIEGKAGGKEGGIAKGFVTGSLLYCVGAMAIMGALESGLTGNHEILFAKSVLDGITAIIFGSSLGIGVALSSIAIFLYQGFITITASLVKDLLVDPVVVEMSAIGGLLIMGISINILEIKKIRVGNMLPAVFIPILFYIVQPYVMQLITMLGF